MKRTRIVEFLSKLSTTELKRLKKFVDSDYFNTSIRSKELFEILQKAYPVFNEADINAEKIFKKLFGLKKKNPALLRNVVSDLMNVCEHFILHEQLGKKPSVRQQLLYDYYFSRDNLSLAEYVLNGRKKTLSKVCVNDHDFFRDRFMVSHAQFNLGYNTRYRGNLNKLYQKHDLSKLISELDDYYLYEFTTLAAEITNSYRAHNKQFDVKKLLEKIDFFSAGKLTLHPVVLFQLNQCKLLLSGDEHLYRDVKAAFLKHYIQLNRAAKIAALVNLHGFSASRAWQGDKYFLNEMEEWTLLREKLDLVLDDGGKINPIAFWNIVQLKLTRSSKSNATSFVKKYSKHLPEAQLEDTLKLVTATINIHERKFEQAIAQLLTVRKPFFASEIVYRRMLLKCYFETKQWDLLASLLDASEKFLGNNSHQFSEPMRAAFKAFLENFKLLVKARLAKGLKHKTKLQGKLKSTSLVLEEKWFKDKMEQL